MMVVLKSEVVGIRVGFGGREKGRKREEERLVDSREWELGGALSLSGAVLPMVP